MVYYKSILVEEEPKQEFTNTLVLYYPALKTIVVYSYAIFVEHETKREFLVIAREFYKPSEIKKE